MQRNRWSAWAGIRKIYGEIGAGYIHVHHLKPLAEVTGEREIDPIADLIPVCPNCHAMLHRASEPTIEELREPVADLRRSEAGSADRRL